MVHHWHPRESWFQNYLCFHFVGIKAKGPISKWMLQENKARKIFRKTNISYPLIRTRACTYRGKEYSLFGKFGVLCFLVTPVLRFALLPYCRRFVQCVFELGFPSKTTYNYRLGVRGSDKACAIFRRKYLQKPQEVFRH